ncbi:hypothetical protein [Alistipes sp.]|uniref:hypothetical protein n=1 Tax=Alistipes sp. TaxID=1872444 RepID=UPI003A858CA1
MFVEKVGCELPLPRAALQQFAQVFRGNSQLARDLSHGVSVQAVAALRHLHRERVAVIEKNDLPQVVALFAIFADRDEVIFDTGRGDKHSSEHLLYAGRAAVDHAPNPVGDNAVQPLLVCNPCRCICYGSIHKTIRF